METRVWAKVGEYKMEVNNIRVKSEGGRKYIKRNNDDYYATRLISFELLLLLCLTTLRAIWATTANQLFLIQSDSCLDVISYF